LFNIKFALFTSPFCFTLLLFSTIWTYCLNELLLLSKDNSSYEFSEWLFNIYLLKPLFYKSKASLIVQFKFCMKFYFVCFDTGGIFAWTDSSARSWYW
jgi:hypothetical protein